MSFSTWITKPRRAGRAPYNFVPLPPAARLFEQSPAPQSHYDTELLHGEIELTWTAETNFFIRGSHPTQPFQIAGQLALPGSSLRGMTRSLLEIVGESPLEPVNDSQLFFRTVGSDPQPTSRSYEPHAQAYKSRVFRAEPHSYDGVQAGYLTGSRDGWSIQPALRINGLQCFQVESLESWARPRPVYFTPIYETKAAISTTPQPGYYPGVFLASGSIPKKRHQWVVTQVDPAAQRLAIPPADVNAYLESGISPMIAQKRFAFSERSQAVPCFYVKWTDADGIPHVSFGHTHFFRIPYAHTLQMAVPESCRRSQHETRWDLAQSLFGRLPTDHRTGSRSRVFFENAELTQAPTPAFDPTVRHIVLNQPKPTTYQHYAVQLSDDRSKAIHWDGDRNLHGHGIARGHKLYWHRPGAQPTYAPNPTDSTSSLQPAFAGATFKSRILFENLQPHELGALLFVLHLPADCGHHLGMAKAQGFGTFRTDVAALRLINRESRYQSLFTPNSDGSYSWTTGARRFTGASLGQNCETYWAAFAQWLLPDHPHASWSDLWVLPRLQELLVLLNRRPTLSDWLNRTRNLTIERYFSDGRKRSEMDHIAGPQGEAVIEKRRPLPPATQVFTDPTMPSDAL
jgi:hypothetical protein